MAFPSSLQVFDITQAMPPAIGNGSADATTVTNNTNAINAVHLGLSWVW
jgi:hypothetical protein